MPAGIFAIVIVGNYRGDRVTAMRSIIVTMVASLLTLPMATNWYESLTLAFVKTLIKC